MILIAGIQFIISVLGALMLWFTSTHSGKSFFAGGIVVTVNFLLLGIGWSLIFQKKLIALAISLIVFKYAILGLIIYKFITQSVVSPMWFTMGIASFVLSSVIYVLMTNKTRP